MALLIPNTFASKTTDLELSDLDDNFTYLATQLDTVNTTVAQLSTNLSSQSLTLGSWSISEQSGSLFFKYGGVNKMKLDSSGNLSVIGDVVAYETL